jgi:hypothetical protein
MGFTSPEGSIEQGRPVETYKFQTTAGVIYRFTNAETDLLDDNGETFEPAAITRTQPTQSNEKRATELTVTVPYADAITADFSQTFILAPPEGLTTLEIRRTHLTDTGGTFVTFWVGSVLSAGFNGDGEIDVLCRGIKNVFDREGPRMAWGGMCQHVLYDQNCSLTAADFTSFNDQVTAISSSGVEITVASVGSPQKDFVGGKMVKDNGADFRLIVAQNGTTLTIQQPFRSDFAVGDSVDLEQGCDHTLTGDCVNKFNNAVNFGGAPYTPGLNPFSSGLDKL